MMGLEKILPHHGKIEVVNAAESKPRIPGDIGANLLCRQGAEITDGLVKFEVVRQVHEGAEDCLAIWT